MAIEQLYRVFPPWHDVLCKFEVLYCFHQFVIFGVPDRSRTNGGLMRLLEPRQRAIDLPLQLPAGDGFPYLLPKVTDGFDHGDKLPLAVAHCQKSQKSRNVPSGKSAMKGRLRLRSLAIGAELFCGADSVRDQAKRGLIRRNACQSW